MLRLTDLKMKALEPKAELRRSARRGLFFDPENASYNRAVLFPTGGGECLNCQLGSFHYDGSFINWRAAERLRAVNRVMHNRARRGAAQGDPRVARENARLRQELGL